MRVSAINNIPAKFRNIVAKATTPMVSESKILAEKNASDKFVKRTRAKGGKKANKSGCGCGCEGGCGAGCGN